MQRSELVGAIPAQGWSYAQWRASEIDARTERLERQLIPAFAGDVCGCSSSTWAAAIESSRSILRRGAFVTGIDASAAMVDAARLLAIPKHR